MPQKVGHEAAIFLSEFLSRPQFGCDRSCRNRSCTTSLLFQIGEVERPSHIFPNIGVLAARLRSIRLPSGISAHIFLAHVISCHVAHGIGFVTVRTVRYCTRHKSAAGGVLICSFFSLVLSFFNRNSVRAMCPKRNGLALTSKEAGILFNGPQ